MFYILFINMVKEKKEKKEKKENKIIKKLIVNNIKISNIESMASVETEINLLEEENKSFEKEEKKNS